MTTLAYDFLERTNLQQINNCGSTLERLAYSNGAMSSISMMLNGAGYTNSSGARIILTVFPAKNVKNSASASSTTFKVRVSERQKDTLAGRTSEYAEENREIKTLRRMIAVTTFQK